MPPFSIMGYKLLKSVAISPTDAGISKLILDAFRVAAALTAVAAGIAPAGIAPIIVVAVFAGL